MQWKLVPVDPTPEMLVSGQEAWLHKRRSRPAMEDCEEAGALYWSMLAVAPAAPLDDDSRVQVVYEILCNAYVNPEEHWERPVAQRIVEALSKQREAA